MENSAQEKQNAEVKPDVETEGETSDNSVLTEAEALEAAIKARKNLRGFKATEPEL